MRRSHVNSTRVSQIMLLSPRVRPFTASGEASELYGFLRGLATEVLFPLGTSSMVFPLLFGILKPAVVEAGATGYPVAYSNSSSLPEIAGNAAAYFASNDPEPAQTTFFKFIHEARLNAT